MRKALVVGIDAYPDGPLGGCINDAIEFNALIATNGDGAPNFDTKTLLDVQTKSELLAGIEELFSGSADIALLYFSGHGSDSLDGYLVTPDYKTSRYGVSLSEILTLANSSRVQNKIIILDCCFSGKMGIPSGAPTTEAKLAAGVTIMSASESDEVAMEVGGHGVFTSLLLQGLKGGAADIRGDITPASLYSFVDQSLGPWKQRPVFKTNIHQFLSIREVEPKVTKTTLRKLKDFFPNASDHYRLDPSFEFTNDPNVPHDCMEPYAKAENVAIFKELQQLESVGLIEPVEDEHMYFAAMNSRPCRLTALGHHYWRLAKDKRF